MGLDTYNFVISRSPVRSRRVAPCFRLPRAPISGPLIWIEIASAWR